jgi:flagellar assembly protein FliH
MSCKIYAGASPIISAAWPSVEMPGRMPAVPPVHAGELGSTSGELEKRIAQVTAQADARIAQAREAGYAEGENAARGELQPVLQRLAKSLESLSQVRAQLRKQAEQDLVKLTIAIARRVLRRELTVDSDALQGIVVAALERLQIRDVTRVRMHPEHEASIRRHLQKAGVQGLEILPDNSLAPGDLVFDTNRGTFEASIESQLREIERGFTDVLPK